MIIRVLSCVSALLLAALPASADVVRAADDGFQIHLERTSELPSNLQYARMATFSDWWSSAHTYSGDAENLSLTEVAPGGIWVETWEGGSVLHGEVIAAMHRDGNHVVRFDASFGPLQSIGVEAVLTISINQDGERSKVVMDYFVTGASFQALSDIAPVVDAILTEQINRLVDP